MSNTQTSPENKQETKAKVMPLLITCYYENTIWFPEPVDFGESKGLEGVVVKTEVSKYGERGDCVSSLFDFQGNYIMSKYHNITWIEHSFGLSTHNRLVLSIEGAYFRGIRKFDRRIFYKFH